MANAWMVADLKMCVQSAAKSAFYRAPMVRLFSAAVKPRRSHWLRLEQPKTRRNLIPTPEAKRKRNFCSIITFRTSQWEKPVESAVQAGGKSVTEPWRNGR